MSFDLKSVSIAINNRELFRPISLSIAEGEVAVIMGPSGSGKSTLLAAISGVLNHQFSVTGEMFLNTVNIQTLPIEKRGIGLLFQDDLLFPHLTVAENLAFALPSSLDKKEKLKRIQVALQSAELENFEHRDVATLSGGQRARISLLRTLLSEPKLVLLDEPFSKLDADLRQQFRYKVFEQIKQFRIPAILVTHDINDAPESSNIIVLENCHA